MHWWEKLPELNQAIAEMPIAVSYTHLRAHETVLDLVCRLLLEKKKNNRIEKVFSVRVVSSSKPANGRQDLDNRTVSANS